MPSSFSTNRADLCRHPTYRVGCVSCVAHAIRGMHEDAVAEEKKHGDVKRGYDASRSQTSGEELAALDVKIKRATAAHDAKAQKVLQLQEAVSIAENGVKRMCNDHSPEQLAEAFEEDGAENEHELEEIWRVGAGGTDERGFVRFRDEDPNRPSEFVGLDPSKIPATPDILVTEGVGLWLFLVYGRNKGPNDSQLLPSRGIGHHRDRPAVMSYGRALDMFRAPDEAGKVKQPDQHKDSDNPPSLEYSMAACSLYDTPKPTTERDWRLQYGSPTVSILLSDEQESAEDKQWAIFKAGKHILDTANLTREYAKLCEEKPVKPVKRSKKTSDEDGDSKSEQEEEEEHGTSTGEAVAAEAPSTSTTTGWPAVEEKDFAGLTNWIQRCRDDVDQKFERETCKLWRDQRKSRTADLKAKLEAWQGDERFNDDAMGWDGKKPSDFWPHDKPLNEYESEKLGKTKTTH